ncbi:MAG: hypothetical protein K2F64_00540 [Muribaculaceae bacterium]|nr:hypothetical protein [Muribaculaceae bacterium]
MSNSRNFSLIIPAAADSGANPDEMPVIFTLDNTGAMLCVKSILGLNLDVFDKICFTVLRKHVDRFNVDVMLELQFRRYGLDKADIVILEEKTSSQAETIVKTVEKENISGPIFIKDADCCFKADVIAENGVAVYPLENLELVDPRNKSYVAVDDMRHITNIIEKRIISHLFNAGGYCFEDASKFVEEYHKHKDLGDIYLSHLIYSMLLEREVFRPIEVSDYSDWNLKKQTLQ